MLKRIISSRWLEAALIVTGTVGLITSPEHSEKKILASYTALFVGFYTMMFRPLRRMLCRNLADVLPFAWHSLLPLGVTSFFLAGLAFKVARFLSDMLHSPERESKLERA